MPERSRNVRKARSPRRANEDFLHPSQGSASSYRSSRRGSDTTLSESIGSLDDDEDAPGDSEDEDEDQSEVDLSTMTPAERLAYKRRMKRFRLNHNQTRFLLSEFARQQHPDAAHRARLAQEIPGLSSRQVQVWFQNRRAKLKRLPSDEQSQVMGSRALPPEYLSAQTQSFQRIEPTHPQSAYPSSLAVDPSTLKPPPPPSVSLTPPTYTHSPISAYGSSVHASPITPEQADDFWSIPYAQSSLGPAPDMLAAQPYPPGGAAASSLQYPASDFSPLRSASLTGHPAAQQPIPTAYESSYTQHREFYYPAPFPHRPSPSSSFAVTGGGPTSQWQLQQAAAPPPPPPPRRPSARYPSSLTHSHYPLPQQPPPPGIRVDENEYRRARANSGDSLFITTMEELRINPTAQAQAEPVGFAGPSVHQQQQQQGFHSARYGGGDDDDDGYYGSRQRTGRGQGRGEEDVMMTVKTRRRREIGFALLGGV